MMKFNNSKNKSLGAIHLYIKALFDIQYFIRYSFIHELKNKFSTVEATFDGKNMDVKIKVIHYMSLVITLLNFYGSFIEPFLSYRC